MLKTLYIKDYAILEQVNVQFGAGLNIITGETGAGKTILIDAMSLLLGERASTEVIRKDTDKSVVEGIFEVPKNKKIQSLLEQNEIDNNSELIIRREISLKGSNRCFINDTPVQLTLIKELGDLLVDLHGQHEHQSLLKTDTHIEYLDNCGDTEDLLRTFRWLYKSLNKLRNELQELKEKESSLKEKKDLYEFQIKEIDAVSPGEDEEEKLNEELTILENAERLHQISSELYQNLYESENSVYDSLMKMKNSFEELSRIDKSFSETNNEYTSAITIINEIANNLRDYDSKIEFDQDKLESIRERLGSISLLKKKYGGSVKSVIEHRKKIGGEYEIAENYSGKISELETKIKAVRENCGATAEKLSVERKKAAKKVEKDIIELLKQVGIPNSKFHINIKNIPSDGTGDFIIIKEKPFIYNINGYDEVQFFISTNIGEDVKPLAKVASGGEISRIMLTLKSILAQRDKLPLLIFDEIDTGISGHIAQKVGQKLKELASHHQVIAITHLPQISGLADYHYAVEKVQTESRVISRIKILNNEERIKEIAKLMSGENITEASIKGAKELMGLK
ncbi:MAG: DNA repair protein RecN [Ignavibacteriales bacterium]|nr:MAG: DNA repair protein RecN [Ignavibacteriales bacterium]